MREITVISGKGGTGKTSLTGAFAQLADNHVVCDLDVDAADLHLLLQPRVEHVEAFHAGHHAVIRAEDCDDCGLCRDMCRFDAIEQTWDGPVVDRVMCEGCKVCVYFCPREAIDFPTSHCGEWYRSHTRFAPMIHARLFPGAENSGLLVSLLRREARQLAREEGRDLILCDGAPGIGCPVISSLTGTDLAVAVTEPTPSGRHDLERVADLCTHFGIPLAVIINKHDLNLENSRAVEEFAAFRGITIAARLPYDPAFIKAMMAGQVITEFQSGGVADLVRRAWADIQAIGECRIAA
jgi:MinD superfamily P-loop ATPase